MRIPYIFLASCLAALTAAPMGCTPALAHPTAGAADYDKATMLLTEGKDFEQAITLLQDAVKADPKNSDYHLALGCAYADRAASIGHAFEFQQMHTHYVDQYKDRANELAKVRQQWGVGTYLKTALPDPSPPPAFKPYTKDDGKAFNMSQDQVELKMASLGTNAIEEWKEAVQLTGDAKARAQAEYVQGYGLEILSQYGKLKWRDDQSDSDAPTLPSYPTQDDAVATLHAAVKDAPNNALYWEGLGGAQFVNDSQSTEAIANLRKALALKPRRSALWYIFFDTEGWRDRKNDMPDLEQAMASDPNNALPWYLLAYLYTERTPLVLDAVNSGNSSEVMQAHPKFTRQKARLYLDGMMAKTLTAEDGRLFHLAIAALEKANAKPECTWPPYQPPVPPMLLSAWLYSHHHEGFVWLMAEIRELARAITGIVDVSANEGNISTARREAQDIVKMGQRIIRYDQGLGNDNPMRHTTDQMVGQSIEAIGYGAEGCVATVAGDKEGLQATQAILDRAQAQNERLLGESMVEIQFDFPYWDY